MQRAFVATTRRPLIGRSEELAELQAFLDRAVDGRAVLVLEGEAGIGKSALLRALAVEATGRGLRVLLAAPAEAEHDHGYAALTDLLGPVLDAGSHALPEPLGDAIAVALRRARAQRPPDAAAVGAATRTLLEDATTAEPRRTLVLIDDAQWLDPESAAALAFAARRTGGSVSYAVAHRGLDNQPLVDLFRDAGRETHFLLRPRPLSSAAVHRLCREILGHGVRRPTLARIAEASGGNPFVVRELARAWGDQPSRDAEFERLPLPGSVLDLVISRITAVSADGRTALLLVALDGRPRVAVVEAALGSGAADALLEAERAGLLEEHDGRIEVAHPLLATAATSLAASVELRNGHARLAAVLDDPVDRARHMVAAGRDDAATVRQVAEAGRLALARGASATAARLLAWSRRAVAGDDRTEAAGLAVAEARARLAMGELSAARWLAELAIRSAPPIARADTIASLADLAWSDGTIERELARVRSAVGTGSPATDRALRRHLVALEVATDPATAVEDAGTALQLLDPDADPAAAGYLTIQREMARALAGGGVDWAALAEGMRLEAHGLDEGGLSSPPLVLFTMTDQIEAARTRFAAEDEWYEARGDDGWRAERRGQLALAELRAGNVGRARQLAADAGAMHDMLDEPGAWPLVGAWRALVAAHAGRVDEASDLLAEAQRGLAEEATPLWRAILASAEAFTAWVAGRDGDVLAAVERMDAFAARAGTVELLADRSEPVLATIAARHADVAGAGAALERLERRHSALPRAWSDAALPRVRALVHAAGGNVEAALRDLEAGDPALLARLPFEEGWSLLLRGRLLRRAGSRREAVASFEAAQLRFEDLEAPHWAAEAVAEARRVGLRRGGPGTLTPSELVIARLVASGLTTQRVAEAAFVSPKTVEANLTRIYRKLGIGSRAELGGRMRDLDEDGPGQT